MNILLNVLKVITLPILFGLGTYVVKAEFGENVAAFMNFIVVIAILALIMWLAIKPNSVNE